MSGIGERDFHNVVWYKKQVTITKEAGKERVILHFGAADYKAMVWVNGNFAGEHSGGNTPFAFDITEDVIAPRGFYVRGLGHQYIPALSGVCGLAPVCRSFQKIPFLRKLFFCQHPV